MKRAAVRAGLAFGSGPKCQLDLSAAAEMAELAKELRMRFSLGIPGLASALRSNGGGLPMALQTWCDQQRLESMKGTVPTLTQLLQIEDDATRQVLVRELTRSNGSAATVELAIRAIADLSPTVRRAALAGLVRRDSSHYLPVLLEGLRYPWPPVADHAAVALRALKPREAIAPLVDLIDLPSPTVPVHDARTNRYVVREMVRLNHLRNCLLCHAPSANKEDGLVRAVVPTPGQRLSIRQYYGSSEVDIDFVQADFTFLRPDFSIILPEKNAAPWPDEQRYDFVVRNRPAKSEEITGITPKCGEYPQRDAVLYALRGLTSKDAGGSSAAWRAMLGLSSSAARELHEAPLDKSAQPPKDSMEGLD